jgi:uncharacterized iron-regulated protein
MREIRVFIEIIIYFTVIGIYSMAAHSETSEERCSFWLDLYRGEPIGFEELLDDLSTVQVIYLGELHTIQRHHRIQQRIVEALVKRGRGVVLAIEQMEVCFQNELDRYNRGEISFERLAMTTDWESRWSNYLDYRELIENAHRSGASIIAINAKDEIIKVIARKGISGLSRDERTHIPDQLVLDDPLYERLLEKILPVHRFVNHKNLRSIYEAQISRDEVMAYAISRRLRDSRGKDMLIIVIGGSMHFAHGLGVPSRVRRHEPELTDRIVLLSESGDLTLTEHEKRISKKINLTHQDLRFLNIPIADYIHVTEPMR